MNIKLKRIIVAVTGSAVMLGTFAPLILPGEAAPRRFVERSYQIPAAGQATAGENQAADPVATPEEQLEQTPEQAIVDTEVVVADDKGDAQRLKIAETGKQTAAVVADSAEVKQLQREVERGQKQWLLDPVAVVKNHAAKYGFNAKKDSFTLISEISVAGKGKAYVLVGHGKQYYLVELNQPAGSAGKKIWQIRSIKEVSVVAKPEQPNVGSGVAGLDYNKVIKWQQNVDEGREQWRLDPLQVAKNEGKQYYGFRDNAQYKVIRRLSSSSIARHGQIDLEVTQNGKRYVMILVRPFGSDDGAIWTTYRVYEAAVAPGQPSKPSEKVLFQTNKYKDWTWYKPQYPQGMGVAVVYDRQPQLRAMQLPSQIMDRLNKENLTGKVALVAYLGGTSSQYGIGVEKVSVAGNEMTVNVRTKSPRIGAPETRDLVYPADFVLVDRSLFKGSKPMNVTFKDQNGKVLGKVQVSIQ